MNAVETQHRVCNRNIARVDLSSPKLDTVSPLTGIQRNSCLQIVLRFVLVMYQMLALFRVKGV